MKYGNASTTNLLCYLTYFAVFICFAVFIKISPRPLPSRFGLVVDIGRSIVYFALCLW
jgi:hypothetical protein